MDGIMKVVGIVALVGAAYALYGKNLPKMPGLTRTQQSSMNPGKRSGNPSVEAARRELQAAQEELMSAQRSTAGTGTNYDETLKINGQQVKGTWVYDNTHVDARSARIRAATKRVQAAQLKYAQALKGS